MFRYFWWMMIASMRCFVPAQAMQGVSCWIAVTVSLMGPNGQPVRSWSFADAFPVKWTGPNLNASSNQVATETLEIVHAGLQVQGV